jgi:hypothetical protein
MLAQGWTPGGCLQSHGCPTLHPTAGAADRVPLPEAHLIIERTRLVT